MLEHSQIAAMRQQHPDWIWNRSDTHVILGVPRSHEGFKTPVEPGNSFSPGIGTYGVSTWVFVNNQLHAPENKPLDELTWNFLDGHLPVLISKWQADSIAVTSRLFTDGDAPFSDIKDYLAVELQNTSDQPVTFSFYLAIRSFGAAGGPIRSLAFTDGHVMVNGGAVIYPSQLPSGFGAVSYAQVKSDISVSLQQGKLPTETQVQDDSTWASGALAYSVTLQAGEHKQFDFVFHVHANHSKLKWLKVPEPTTSVDRVQEAFILQWRNAFHIQLDLPDQRVTDAFFTQLVHLYMFTVDDEPRITPVSYPLWWLRDGAYVVNALDKGGFHDFAERAVKRVADRDAFGGFGAEGDGPSEGIWIISEHYLMTGSLDYLREMYPHIERKADLLCEMLTTTIPIKRYSDSRTPANMLAPDSDLMCLPAQDGMIIGRMDGHFPIMWINGFAYFALKRAAQCAEALGLDGSRYQQTATKLQQTLLRKTPELFGQNDRNPNSAFWPTGWASRDNKDIQEGFENFWNTVRYPNGVHAPEPMWTYFEAGQAHNYMLLGQRERTWVSLEYFLRHHIAPGLYTYSEGNSDENSSLLWQRTRGWDHINYVTPHGWTAAEIFLLLRDCLVREEDDKLIIGSGVPAAWMQQAFSVRNLPTHFGSVSFSFTPETNTLDLQVDKMPTGGILAEFPAPVELVMTPANQSITAK
jgi:hypothetical protein